MNDLVKLKEYEVLKDDGRAMYVTVPILWLRDNCRPGDKIALYAEAGSSRLVIQKIEENKK